ncbi:hypothetical protein BBJ29_006556 [Phytophthora kernoviae]|uniref:Protein kinase domain-containing protein n=1 Tax=Phytophthora kernoviae TaxID=325452 RepID=A0A3F2RES2_9STRA|nr:hypothetical protein BBP00_00008671 [Phytophthora kernoviae]RLN61806.1 hypothetical protein BBJ29_006556 [Phytophthora kernoviae]
MNIRRDRQLTSYMNAVLPSNDIVFSFDGTNSDLARQLYFRAKANQSAAQFVHLTVPPAVQNRLDDLHLQWDQLPGIAQRALLWDSGFAVTPQNDVVQIWTLGGYSLTDLAVPLTQFRTVGCLEMNCTQPDNSTAEFLVDKRIPYENITFERALSKGSSGEVWRCEYMGQRVAVKRLLRTKNHRAEEVEHFAKEIELSASLDHPHIASFIGVAWNSLDNLVMVLEFFPMGDLQTYLYKNIDLLTWANDKIHIAAGIGRALEYLHSRTSPLIHRDLKAKNILLTKMLDAKLIDFGVSRNCQDSSMTAGVGTPYWTAPEVLEGKCYTEQADIYSFGVVLSELDTCEIPYHDAVSADGKKLKPFQLLTEVIQGTLRPSFSEECPQRIRRLAEACCQHDSERRPTASQLVAMLEARNIRG